MLLLFWLGNERYTLCHKAVTVPLVQKLHKMKKINFGHSTNGYYISIKLF